MDQNLAICSHSDQNGEEVEMDQFPELPKLHKGTFKFQGYPKLRKNSTAKFAVVEPGASKVEDVWQTFVKDWRVMAPKIILSINGGAKKMAPMTQKLQNALKKGLTKVSSSACTWLFTSGSNVGVSKLVGEAVREYKLGSSNAEFLVLIGISTFGSVYHHDDIRKGMESSNGEGCFLYRHHQHTGKGQALLDPDHTNFIFYDDGSEKTYNREIEFRVNFENHVASKIIKRRYVVSRNSLAREGSQRFDHSYNAEGYNPLRHSDNCFLSLDTNIDIGTPIVQIVIEGGKKTIETTAVAVRQQTPTILIKGSGRCADLMCELLESTSETTTRDEITLKTHKLLEKVTTDWNLREPEIQNYTEMLVQMCREHRKLLTIFSVDGVSNELDRAILEAVFKNSRLSPERQLVLALDMNRCDLAKSELFSQEKNNEWTIKNLENPMMRALKGGQAEFVKHFIEFGVNIREFLTKERLERLYKYAVRNPSYQSVALLPALDYVQSPWWSSLFSWDCCNSGRDYELLHSIGAILNKFTADLVPNPYEFEENEESSKGGEKRIYRCEHQNGNKGGAERVTMYPPRTREGQRRYTEQDLFFWALLLNRIDLAMIFWRIGKDHIGAALIACGIFKHMRKIASEDGEVELAESFKENSRYFELMATAVLTKAYEQDKTRAHSLLFRGLPFYGNETPLALADQYACLDFMSHSAVQTKMSSIWMGKMSINVSNWKILLNLICPIIFIRLIFPYKMRRKRKMHLEAKFKGKTEPDEEENPRVCQQLWQFKSREKSTFTSVKFSKAVYFFYQAPVIKFLISTVSSVVFLVVLCYLTMVQLAPCRTSTSVYTNTTSFRFNFGQSCVSVEELLVWVWIFGLFLEEMRQIIAHEQKSTSNKLKEWWSNGWNKFDILLHILFVAVLIVRFTVSDNNFHIVRNMYAILMSLFFMRFMQTYYVNRFVGPKVVMIAKMMSDIAFFLVIFVIYLFAYGTAAQALLYPNSPLDWNLLKKIVYQPYFQIYGELNLEEPEGMGEGAQKSSLVIILFSIYMLLTNVLMLSLLIAMFGYTFENIQSKSLKIWAYKRHDLIFEFVGRPLLPPPFIIFPIFFRIFRHIYHRLSCTEESSKSIPKAHNRKKILGQAENRQMSAFEQQCKEQVLSEVLKNERMYGMRDIDALQKIVHGSRIKFSDHHGSESGDDQMNFREGAIKRLDRIEERIATIKGTKNDGGNS